MKPQQTGLVVGALLFALVIMHFTIRPLLGDERVTPDFLLLALMLYAIRSRPGPAAIAGFGVGVLADALRPVAFGASALAHTVIGYLLAWGKAVFFPENLLVTTGFLFAGAWIRNFLVVLAGGQVQGMELLWTLGVWSVAQAATTTLTGIALVVVFRRWFNIGIIQ